MQKTVRSTLLLVLSTLAFAGAPLSAQAEPNQAKEFIMSCTYGVLAGTLVGAASLAFVDKPGDNLQRVARGASLGLYTGIALGYYTVFYLPKMLQREEEERLDPDKQVDQSKSEFRLFPILADRGTYGVGMGFSF